MPGDVRFVLEVQDVDPANPATLVAPPTVLFDGVITNGLIYNVPGAQSDLFETKGFNSQDGIALQWLIWSGFQTGVITGRESVGSRPCGRGCRR